MGMAEEKAKALRKRAEDMEYHWQRETGVLLNTVHPTFSSQRDFVNWCGLHLNISKPYAFKLMKAARLGVPYKELYGVCKEV